MKEKMKESPSSLQETCLNFISENITALCEVQAGEDASTSSLVFRGPDDVFFPSTLSDQLLCALSDNGHLSDEVLSLFNTKCTNLKRVKIKDANISAKGLRVFKDHKIVDFEATGLKNVTINDIVNCLGEKTLTNLRNINLMNNTFMNSSKYCVVVSLSKLRFLQCLNVSNTEFNEQGLDIVAQDLSRLECLNISNTPVSNLSSLRRMRTHLVSLSMYNLRASHTEDLVSVLCDLNKLKYLDVSDDYSVQPFVSLQPVKFQIFELLERSSELPDLTYLDISGKAGLTEDVLKRFLCSHPDIQFLGLSLTDACEFPVFTDVEQQDYNPNLKVTGDSTEEQLIESLRRYEDRNIYIQRTLYHLFRITQTYTEPTGPLIKLILPAMKHHPQELAVQMAATACLYNLSRAEGSTKVHPLWLSKIVGLTMEAMENFPTHKQLQKNALLTLCSDRILQSVSFDRFRCARLVMDCLCSFEDPSMDRMSVAICGILAAKIPTEQTSQLGAKDSYMKKLLSIVEMKTKVVTIDFTLKFTLSALWNLTDESPSTCEMFMYGGGLDLFADVLQTFKDQPSESRVQVETKVLGLVNNLAEVRHQRYTLLNHPIMNHIKDLLHAELIDVSYFAAGIVSHLVSDDSGVWDNCEDTRQVLLENLGTVVLKWEQPQGEMVAYRSFTPFFPLLSCWRLPHVQLWAVWAMHHVCTKNEERYCGMLVNEGGASKLLSVIRDPGNNKHVTELAENILSIVNRRLGPSWKTVALMDID